MTVAILVGLAAGLLWIARQTAPDRRAARAIRAAIARDKHARACARANAEEARLRS